MAGSAMSIESRLIVVLLVYKVVPRIFTRTLNKVRDASRFSAGRILKFSQWFGNFVLVSGLDRDMYSQNQHWDPSTRFYHIQGSCKIPVQLNVGAHRL